MTLHTVSCDTIENVVHHKSRAVCVCAQHWVERQLSHTCMVLLWHS